MNATRSRSKSSKSSASRKSSAKSRAGKKGGAKTAQQRRAQGTSAKSASAKSPRGAKAARSTRAASRNSAGGTASRSRTPVGQAIEILLEDHKKVQTMFRQAERAKKDAEKLQEIVEAACQALTLHSEIEEQHFYPVLRESLKETGLIAEALIEHTSAKQLIAELESGDPEDEQYAAMFTVLGEYVKHHIKEEEGEIFPKARRARGDFEPLLEALQARDESEQAGEQQEAAMQGEAQQRGTQRERAGRRQTRGRRGSRGRGSDESTQNQAEAGMESTAETATADVEQPRRGRRGQADETGETESAIHGRDQESAEEGTRGSRQSGR